MRITFRENGRLSVNRLTDIAKGPTSFALPQSHKLQLPSLRTCTPREYHSLTRCARDIQIQWKLKASVHSYQTTSGSHPLCSPPPLHCFNSFKIPTTTLTPFPTLVLSQNIYQDSLPPCLRFHPPQHPYSSPSFPLPSMFNDMSLGGAADRLHGARAAEWWEWETPSSDAIVAYELPAA